VPLTKSQIPDMVKEMVVSKWPVEKTITTCFEWNSKNPK